MLFSTISGFVFSGGTITTTTTTTLKYMNKKTTDQQQQQQRRQRKQAFRLKENIQNTALKSIAYLVQIKTNGLKWIVLFNHFVH